MTTSPTPSNHLAGQTSAYLAQHQRDPVDWYPWSAEAFDLARRLNRPVFLSIGYASCHWCHVMQRESFRDQQTADYLNAHFVSIKVDREERPDIDHVYLQYVTFAAGSAGWPMTVFVDATRRPFYGGTYFPKHAPANMQSLAAVLTGVEGIFREDPERIAQVATQSVTVLADLQAPKPTPTVDRRILAAAIDKVSALDDPEFGGLGSSPKYPAAPLFDLLLAYHRATGDSTVLDIAERWMYGMLRGGIFDQAGGGLFRYSTDRLWLVPHFEKMLLDNAQLLSSIAGLYAIAPSEELARAARMTASFMARDLARPQGGYWSSIDSESAGIEGGAYTWDLSDLREALDDPQMDLARRYLDVPDDVAPGDKVILTRNEGRIGDAEAVDRVLETLLAARAQRPLRVIRNAPVDTNALAARGLIDAGVALGDRALVEQGAATLRWLLKDAVRGTRVLHMVDDPATEDLDLLGDHGALAIALIAARDAGVDLGLDAAALAAGILDRMLDVFEDGGAFYMTRAETDLPVRPAAYDDGTSPSGWALALEVHRRLRPDDAAARAELSGPLNAFALYSPFAAGTALKLAVGDLWPDE